MKHLVLFTVTMLLITGTMAGQQPQLKKIINSTGASFRGLSVVDDSVAWVSGTKGWVGRSANGGRDWTFRQVKGYEQCDFRSLYAFDANKAIIANAGAPAYILGTRDGGQSWKLLYTNADSAAFFDGVTFRNDKEGLIYGDPINGRMLLLRTNNGGDSWEDVPEQARPAMEKNEASFAASGTAIRSIGNGKIVIATGGSISRLLVSEDKGKSWRALATPMLHGLASQGTFSIACRDSKNMIIAGGDYKQDLLRTDHIFLTNDGGKTWQPPATATGGYRECVEYAGNGDVVATGPGGTDISHDNGMHWQPLEDHTGYHVIRKARNGRLLLMAGSDGRIAVLEL